VLGLPVTDGDACEGVIALGVFLSAWVVVAVVAIRASSRW
jgi:uncharacterized membrane protein (DUF485 family)